MVLFDFLTPTILEHFSMRETGPERVQGPGSILGTDLEKFWEGWEMLAKLAKHGAGKYEI